MNVRLAHALVAVLLIALMGAAHIDAQGCETIEWRSPEPFGYMIYDVAFGDGVFVALAGRSHVAVSSDGETWTLHRVCSFEDLFVSVNWDGSQFIITSNGGRAYTSPDGVDWTQHHIFGSSGITGIVSIGTRSVASDFDGWLATSTDWQSWSVVYYSPERINALAASDSEFIAVGDFTTILRSTDGINWSDVSPTLPAGVAIHDVRWNGSQFVAVGVGGHTFRSTDGLVWQESSVGFSFSFTSLTWDGSRWVAMGGYKSLRVYSSLDGNSWTFEANDYFPDNSTRGIAFGNGIYVIVGDFGLNLTSTDRSTWINHSSGPYERLRGVATNGTQLVAVGESGTTVSSPTGKVWSSHPLPSAIDLYGVAWSGTEFLAVGETGSLWASPDGESWSSRTISGVIETLNELVAAADFVAVGGAGTIARSSDGVVWTTAPSTVIEDLHAVTTNGSVYVAVGDGGTIVSSPDSTTWTQRTSGTTRDLRTVLWDGLNFYATGHNGDLVLSSDGLTWSDGDPLTFPNGSTTHDLKHHMGTYVAANYGTGIMTSPDMTNWTVIDEWDTFHALAPTSTGMVAVGLHGSIIGLECWGVIFADGFETGTTSNWSAGRSD